MSQSDEHDALLTTDAMHSQKFCIEVARCFLAFGAPAHHLEAQLNKAAAILGIKAEFLLLPNTVFASFYDEKGGSDAAAGLHAIKKIGSLSVTQLRRTYSVYKKVINRTLSPEKAWKELLNIQETQPPHSEMTRVLVAFLCGAVITCLAFDGSFLDAMIAGAAQGALAFLMFKMIGAEPVIARIFESVPLYLVDCISISE